MMLNMLALLGVLLTALYFIGLAAVALAIPERAGRFLASFAETPIAHFVEMTLRLRSPS
ncbi:hypothetical protein PFX98_10990 [Paucibacter sediminis]|uniref:Uncharacterized protein n=1 Tax=Paucibacter sediminis TaxID=3019553 RepID=A0AA95SR11_9BURK|nr:hypothetical protein [Paucibacter sp. S2-9]WIT14120.1 hypothetical protein PFX98_10990 [Paucibacter sp. S2-9]